MLWFFIGGIILFILFKFLIAYNKDNYDLQGQTLDQKFKVTVNALNKFAFQGLGKVTILDKREFNLYKEGENQIIQFLYSTGNLTIIWKFKYFQKEVVHEELFEDVRNLSIFEQQKIADYMINEMKQVVGEHKLDVWGNSLT